MIVLEQCDRFLVGLRDNKVERVAVDGTSIALMHLGYDQIAKFPVELFEVADPAEIGAA